MNEDNQVLIYPKKGMYIFNFMMSIILITVGILIFLSLIKVSLSIPPLIGAFIALCGLQISSVRRNYRNNERVLKYVSPIKDAVLFLLCSMVILSLGLFDETQPALKYGLGTLCILLFGFTAFLSVCRWVTSKPVLVINNKGISVRSVGEIEN